MNKPNIILLMCDQFRSDCLAFNGHPDVKTPYLDTLATTGFNFDNAYTACPSCIPARVALFTGKSPKNHGRVGYEDGIPWNYEHMLAQELSDNGYQTQCVGKMHVDPPRLSCGFNNIKLHDGYLGYYRSNLIPHYQHQEITDDYLYYLKDREGQNADISVSGLDCNSWLTHPWIYQEKLHPTNWVVDESIRFLKTRDRTKPFFLMSSFVRPHQPFDAPKTYFDIYKNKSLRKPAKGDWVDPSLTEKYGSIKDSIYGCKDEDLRNEAMCGYYACITHVDHQIGRLINSLIDDGTYDDSIILFLSDHGELLFDNNLYRKALPYQGSCHIPLIIHVGDNIKHNPPFRSDSLVELRDILPTILDFAGIKIPNGVDGISLTSEICNNNKINREYLHGEHSFHSKLSSHYIVTKSDKFIWFSEKDEEQYFNLNKDPREEHNLINDIEYKDRIDYLRNYLIKELKDREECYSDGLTLKSGCKPVNTLSHIL